MERSSVLFVVAATLYAFSLVEVSPSFLALPAEPGAQHGSLRLRGATPGDGRSSTPSAWRATLQTASTFVALSACALASRARSCSSGRTPRTRLAAETNFVPAHVFTDALLTCASKAKESVAVTRDVLKVKKLLAETYTPFEQKMHEFVNMPLMDGVEKANGMLELINEETKLESTVFPKFVKYLAKKKRLNMLKKALDQYVVGVYDSQKIEPVVCKSAQALTDAQKKTIKEKMMAKLGVTDIKLICEVNPRLEAGLALEWGFVDPEKLYCPTGGSEFTMKMVLEKMSTSKGVPIVIA